MCEFVGGDKVVHSLNGEHALFLTQNNSTFDECE
jgi:hypothetical protein